MPTNENSSTFAGAGYLFAGGLGAELTAAATITLTSAVHVVSGTATITTINGGDAHASNVAYLVKKSGATWQFGSGGNIAGTIPTIATNVATLVWDQSFWRVSSSASVVQYIDPASMTAVDFRAACTAVQAAGGGAIFVGPGVIDNTAVTQLGNFSNCAGITIRGYGTTIQNTTPTTASLGYVLFLSNCTNVDIGGFVVTGTASATDVRSTTVKNEVFCAVAAGCVNVNFHDVEATGILAPFEVYNQDGAGNPTTPVVENVTVKNVKATNCWYGMNCQFGPKGLFVRNLRTDTVHRSFLGYGMTNFDVEIFSKDAWSDDCLLHSLGGHGSSNGRVVYHSGPESLARSDSSALVALAFDFGATPATFRNIRIVLDVEFAGTGTANTGQGAFAIRKYTTGGSVFDTVDRGHILDGLDISGTITFNPFFTGLGIIDVDPNMKWGSTLDSWYNINVHDLRSSSAVFCRLSLASLKGTLNIENVDIGAEFILQQDNYLSAPDLSLPQNGRWSIRNSKFTNLRYFTGSAVAIEPISLSSSVSIPVSFSGQMISNGSAVGAIMPVLPSASAGNIALGLGPMTFLNVNSAGTFRVDPNGTDIVRGGGAGKYVDLALGSSMTIIPTSPGVWQIVSSYGTVTFEP